MKKQSYSEAVPVRRTSSISLTAMVQAAMIAAIYVVLTFIANAFGLANYAIQVRFSEALTILPFFTPAAIPGLFIGCLLSNILTDALCLILFSAVLQHSSAHSEPMRSVNGNGALLSVRLSPIRSLCRSY